MNILEAIPELYEKNGGGRYIAGFSNMEEARTFCLGIQEKIMEFGLTQEECRKCITQRNTNVVMDIVLVEDMILYKEVEAEGNVSCGVLSHG